MGPRDRGEQGLFTVTSFGSFGFCIILKNKSI